MHSFISKIVAIYVFTFVITVSFVVYMQGHLIEQDLVQEKQRELKVLNDTFKKNLDASVATLFELPEFLSHTSYVRVAIDFDMGDQLLSLLEGMNIPRDMRILLVKSDNSIITDFNAPVGEPSDLGFSGLNLRERGVYVNRDVSLSVVPLIHKKGDEGTFYGSIVGARRTQTLKMHLADTYHQRIYEYSMLKPKLNFEFDSKKYFKLSEVPISFQSSIERSESLTDWKNLLIIILLGMVGLTLGTYYIYKELKRPLKKTDSIIAFIAKNPSGKYESKLPRDSQFKRLADSLLSLHEDRKKLEKENIALESEKVLSQMASQVAHDIRSPLVALKVVASDSKKLSEKQRTIIRNATTRIYDIAENLLSETKIKLPVAKQSVDRHMLAALISSLVSEKRTQHSGVHGLEINEIFSNSCYGVFVQVNQRELKRVLSNLINNSVEALDGPGLVEVSVNVQPNFAEVVVSDNGPGIPASLQEKVERKGVSFGKPDGSGLGLYHAKNTVEGWGGELKIDSSEEGTSVHISLPRTFAPKWFLSKIDVRNARAIVVLDDDKNIHLFWDKSYVDLGLKDKGVGLYHFTDPVECKKWLIEQPDKRQFKFLFDYELIGHHVTGLDLIEEFGLAQNAVLVTSHDEVAEVLDRCARLNVSLLPKTLAHLVPIEVDS